MAGTTNGDGHFKIGIVIGSQRVVRICPQVAQFVLDVIKSHHTTTTSSSAGAPAPQLDFELLDIAAFDLPLTDEPGMPAHVKDRPAGYATERTRAWSVAVDAFDAFVFVTPQYNWGMPAALKNALDHLFHEWAGKPAMVVAYGGHGGTLGAAALVTVLAGMSLRVVRQPICMSYPGPAFIARAVEGQDIGLDAGSDEGMWADQRAGIVGLWEQVLNMLVSEVPKPGFRSTGLQDLWETVLAPVADIEKKHAAK